MVWVFIVSRPLFGIEKGTWTPVRLQGLVVYRFHFRTNIERKPFVKSYDKVFHIASTIKSPSMKDESKLGRCASPAGYNRLSIFLIDFVVPFRHQFRTVYLQQFQHSPRLHHIRINQGIRYENYATSSPTCVAIIFMYKDKDYNVRARTNPFGIAASISLGTDSGPCNWTPKMRFCKKKVISCTKEPGHCNCINLYTRPVTVYRRPVSRDKATADFLLWKCFKSVWLTPSAAV